MKKKTQECLNNIRIHFPTYENECYAKRTRILRTMDITIGIVIVFKLGQCPYIVVIYSLYCYVFCVASSFPMMYATNKLVLCFF